MCEIGQEQRRGGIVERDYAQPSVKPSADAIYDDIVNNFNICNLSNFKNYLTEELMINVIHIASAGELMGRTYVKFVTQLSPPTKHCGLISI
jgi:hypothetical protein